MRRREPFPQVAGSAASATLTICLLLCCPASALRPVPGWPVSMKVSPSFPPCGLAVADVDGDGEAEVAAGSTVGRVYLWNADGTQSSGWPVVIGGRVQSKPALADLDDDGLPELLVLEGDTGTLWAMNGDGSLVPGWPVSVGPSTGLLAPATLLDQQGEVTVIAPWDGGITAYSASGRILWRLDELVGSVVAAPSACGLTGRVAALTEYGFLYVVDGACGSSLEGFPFLTGQRSSWGAPVLADLEGDGKREVLYTTYEMGQSVFVNCLDEDGRPATGFPVRIPGMLSYSAPVVADLDADSDLEIVLCCTGGEGTVWALDHRGRVLPGWPAQPSVQMEGSPVVADMDGDGRCEVIAASGSAAGGVYCLDYAGRPLDGMSAWGIGPVRSDSPMLADLDGDGCRELLVLTASGEIYAWFTDGAMGRMPWPQLYRDAENDSCAD